MKFEKGGRVSIDDCEFHFNTYNIRIINKKDSGDFGILDFENLQSSILRIGNKKIGNYSISQTSNISETILRKSFSDRFAGSFYFYLIKLLHEIFVLKNISAKVIEDNLGLDIYNRTKELLQNYLIKYSLLKYHSEILIENFNKDRADQFDIKRKYFQETTDLFLLLNRENNVIRIENSEIFSQRIEDELVFFLDNDIEREICKFDERQISRIDEFHFKIHERFSSIASIYLSKSNFIDWYKFLQIHNNIIGSFLYYLNSPLMLLFLFISIICSLLNLHGFNFSLIFYICFLGLFNLIFLPSFLILAKAFNRNYYALSIQSLIPTFVIGIIIGWFSLIPFDLDAWSLNRELESNSFLYGILLCCMFLPTILFLHHSYYKNRKSKDLPKGKNKIKEQVIKLSNPFSIGVPCSFLIGSLFLSLSFNAKYDDISIYDRSYESKCMIDSINILKSQDTLLYENILPKIQKSNYKDINNIDFMNILPEVKKVKNFDFTSLKFISEKFEHQVSSCDLRKKMALEYTTLIENLVKEYKTNFRNTKKRYVYNYIKNKAYKEYFPSMLTGELFGYYFFFFPYILILGSIMAYMVGYFIQFFFKD